MSECAASDRRMVPWVCTLAVLIAVTVSGPIRSSGEAHVLAKHRGPKPDSPGEAWEFRKLQLQDENGRIPDEGLIRAREHMAEMREFARANPWPAIDRENWRWLGPGNIGGRVRSLAIHPDTTGVMFAGSVSGGIWKTTDAGVTWAPVDDFMANLAVSSVIMQPNDPSVMYAGTGEGFYNGDGIRGAGVFKSSDSGTTWVRLPETNTSDYWYVNRLAMSNDGSTLLAATRTGLFRSTDGGNTFSREISSGVGMGITDVDFDPSNSALAVASGFDGNAWYSTDGGDTWTAASGLPPGGFRRVEIAYAPSNPTFVYASVDDSGGSLYQSIDGGASYSLVFNGSPDYLGSQGWYDNALWVDPTNPNVLIVGGIDLWRSTNGGSSWTRISQWQYAPVSAHADHHLIIADPWFDGLLNKRVFFVNDGGVYSTGDVYTVEGTSGWVEHNNNLGVTQFYGAAGHASSGRIIGGTQDNGTLRYTESGGTEGWTTMFGGDGGFNAADPEDPNYFYGEYVRLTIHRSTNGGLSSSYIYFGIADAGSTNANFIAPFILDPTDPNRMLAGGRQLWRTSNVKAASPAWGSIKPSVGVNISAIAVSPLDSNLIWVGHNNGDLYKTMDGDSSAPTWTQMDGSTLPNRFVTRVTINPIVPEEVYVSFGGFAGDNLWKSTDGGISWIDATGSGATGLPDVPVRDVDVLIVPSVPGNPARARVFAATEVGIFTSLDGGDTWRLPHDAPANVSVDELFWMANDLVAATHGRGLYRLTAPSTSQSTEIEPGGGAIPPLPCALDCDTNSPWPAASRRDLALPHR